MTAIEIPTYEDLEPAVLKVLSDCGGSLKRSEIRDRAVEAAGVSEEQLAVTYPEGSKRAGRSVVLDRAGWALSYLKMVGAVESSVRGVWSITPHGRTLLAGGPDAIIDASRNLRQARRESRKQAGTASVAVAVDDVAEEAGEANDDWKSELLTVLTSMQPDAFERLCARLLREVGCRDVQVTSYSGDEGLDGVGVLEVSLLSFPVFFQAKRYKPDHAIQPNKIREFRGAMAHRGDKGFFITTSRFTAAAKDEAKRGGSPIDLVDGDQLCELLRENGLGVELRPVVVEDFFASI